MALLARAADRLYWAARYLERAEDTARIVRVYNDLFVDAPFGDMLRWEPLLAITGLPPTEVVEDETDEFDVIHALLADPDAPSSIVGAVASARENLRATREVLPREAWQAVNSLSQYVVDRAALAVRRQRRDVFLARVIDDSRRFDGVIDSTMSRRDSYRVLRLGRLIERADMTTRVLGVRAASILSDSARAEGPVLVSSELQWMGVLRSVSALQMYQRATKDAVRGDLVVAFLLFSPVFPRSVQACLDEIRVTVDGLPRPDDVLVAVDAADAALEASRPSASDGPLLDSAMDQLQGAIAAVDGAIHDAYVASPQLRPEPQLRSER